MTAGFGIDGRVVKFSIHLGPTFDQHLPLVSCRCTEYAQLISIRTASFISHANTYTKPIRFAPIQCTHALYELLKAHRGLPSLLPAWACLYLIRNAGTASESENTVRIALRGVASPRSQHVSRIDTSCHHLDPRRADRRAWVDTSHSNVHSSTRFTRTHALATVAAGQTINLHPDQHFSRQGRLDWLSAIVYESA